uniref:hypothetical protein n=1 Tax=Escherichia coli TaxID=562 RepID=UPI00200F673F
RATAMDNIVTEKPATATPGAELGGGGDEVGVVVRGGGGEVGAVVGGGEVGVAVAGFSVTILSIAVALLL